MVAGIKSSGGGVMNDSNGSVSWKFRDFPIFFERPPGVPFQKIQFGMHAGGRSVLLDSRTCEDLVL